MKKNNKKAVVCSQSAVIHIYTGDGKGKTTASLGLALRAIGANKKVLIIQFMKKPDFSEHEAIKKYNLPIEIESYGIGFYHILGDGHTDQEHKNACQRALERAREALEEQKYDLIILDEINVALGFNLIKLNDILNILTPKAHLVGGTKVTDVVLTGRKAHPKLIELADLVTEMKEIKHYFNNGLEARKGIEY